MQQMKKEEIERIGVRNTLLENHGNPPPQDINQNQAKGEAIDSGSALQMFLNRIPINSIPGLRNSPVLELKTQDCLRDAIWLLHQKNVFGAPIADEELGSDAIARFSNRYIGFLDFATMVLWCLKEIEASKLKNVDDSEVGVNGFFSIFYENPQIAQTKVGELAKSFLWDPFFPVKLDETLFHILLLISKHPVQVVPVIEPPNTQVMGFITQNAVIQLLLQSSGLEWFDSIADQPLSAFRFANEGKAIHVYGDQSLAEALGILLENQVGAVAVVNRESNTVVGFMSRHDLHALLDDEHLFHKRKELTMEEFIHSETGKAVADPTIERDLGALLSAGTLRLRNNFLPRMDTPVTSKKTDTLKRAMQQVAETKSNFCFLVDESHQLVGMLTLRDIITQFAPPSIDSNINGGGFFESALEQTGCHMENGTMVCDH
ncbi:CBS domain [Dillenia turbinata]|uniref:CBS domain n=1 Tax=Dillenia turbinata TaxID=194707 RepID=A0AAN8WHT0_9MAGN